MDNPNVLEKKIFFVYYPVDFYHIWTQLFISVFCPVDSPEKKNVCL